MTDTAHGAFGGFYCTGCYDTGIADSWLDDFGNPHVGSWDGKKCPECGGDPLNSVPHEKRPHPPDYDCSDCETTVPETTGTERGDHQ